MWKFISRLVADFWFTYVPSGKSLTGFAFIVHPRDYGDVVNNVPILRKLPKKWVMKYFHLVWPFTVSKIRGVKSLDGSRDIPGWVVGVPIFAHEMMEDRDLARKKIARGVRLAMHRGAMVVGLGGLTGSMTEGGAGLSEKAGVIVTAGRAYTSFVVKSYADDVVSRFGLERKDLVIAIVGAAGGVGTAVTNLILGEDYKKIILIDLERKLQSVHDAFIERGGKPDHIEINHRISAVREADIIITVTNAPEAVVEDEDIRPGAIIIDDAQPSDISPEIIANRKDIIVIEAGVISAKEHIRVGTNFRLANPHEVYCCLCEAMAIAASGWDAKYEPRKITPELVSQIRSITAQMGFTLAPYQAYGRIIPEEQIDTVKNIVRKRLYNL
jgi:predicted amino acid dehydrogenase